MTAQAHDTITAVRPARRAAVSLPEGEQSRLAVRELPAAAFATEPAS